MMLTPRPTSPARGTQNISYADEVLVGVATDAKMVPDPGALVEGFHAELDALLDEFGA